MIWSPDSNVLFGPIPEIKNYFCCNGIIPGFSQSGGLGLMTAEWIIKGETKYDLFLGIYLDLMNGPIIHSLKRELAISMLIVSKFISQMKKDQLEDL